VEGGVLWRAGVMERLCAVARGKDISTYNSTSAGHVACGLSLCRCTAYRTVQVKYNSTCIIYTHTHTYIYIHICIYLKSLNLIQVGPLRCEVPWEWN
jgi:hypothetical protein